MKKTITILFLLFIITGCKNENIKNINIFKDSANYKEEYYIDYQKYYNEIKNINETIEYVNFCNENSIDCDIKELKNLYKLKNFDINNINNYINYINTYSSNNYNNVIDIVNKKLENYINKYGIEIENFLIELTNNKKYNENNIDKYINYYIKNKQITPNEVINIINSEYQNTTNFDKNNSYDNYKMADLSKGILVLVNKQNELPDTYIPDDLVEIEPIHGYKYLINSEAYSAFKKMYDDANKENISIFISSPYRSYEHQNRLYNYYNSIDTFENVEKYSARAGHSEHQTGLAIDITEQAYLELSTFENSKSFDWMQKNAYKYGFILRYPKDRETITGYMYEPWHYRYVGTNAATIIKNENLTFEEYYEYYVK